MLNYLLLKLVGKVIYIKENKGELNMKDLSELRIEVKFNTKEIQESLKIIDEVINNKEYTDKEKCKILYYISAISEQLVKDKVE